MLNILFRLTPRLSERIWEKLYKMDLIFRRYIIKNAYIIVYNNNNSSNNIFCKKTKSILDLNNRYLSEAKNTLKTQTHSTYTEI